MLGGNGSCYDNDDQCCPHDEYGCGCLNGTDDDVANLWTLHFRQQRAQGALLQFSSHYTPV